MKFVQVRDLRNQTAKLWELLPVEKEMVITSNGRPVALLSHLTEDTLEFVLKTLRQARGLEALNAIHAQSVANGTDKLSMDDINREIKAARKQRQK